MIHNFNEFNMNEEMEFKSSPTNYSSLSIPPLFKVGKKDNIFRFITKSNTSYDIYFALINDLIHLLSNGKNLCDYTTNPFPTIFFSLTERGLNQNLFDELTNKNEKFEVMSKVIYLVNEYDKLYKYPVYSVGEVNQNKYKFYSNYIHNIPQFKILEGNSDIYNGKKCYYLIK